MKEPFPRLADVAKIALLRPSAVGDFVFALPALHALRRAYAEAEIVYLGKAWHARFLSHRPGPVDRVMVVPPIPGIGEPATAANTGDAERFLSTLRQEHFDIALQMYGGGGFSNPFVNAMEARLTAGLRAPEAAALARCVSYRPLQNRRLQLLEVAALVGADVLPLGPEIQVTESDRREAASVQPVVPGEKPWVLLQPGASDPRRRWPPDRFAALGDWLAEEGAQVAIHGSGEEQALLRQVRQAMKAPALDLGGRLSLSGLCGVLERVALLVSNDTGPLHLALAMGIPSVGIYWFGNFIESAPLRQEGHWPLISFRRHCPVCGAENLATRCVHDESFVADLSLDEVREATRSAWTQIID